LANPKLVKEVKKRITQIKTDYIPETGILEEMIEDHPFSLIPQTIKTERPDRVTSMLVEGKVAILVDNNPFVMLVPAIFFDFLHSPEDHYIRFPYGLWLRIIRIAAIFITSLLPAFYVAIATFHQEMIPTDLLLAITASKERVPFPTIVEMLLMEFSFELVREAGVRVPGVIGPTLGIVGTLILGQAAVAANIVSPVLIIIVAVTGLSSYAIPNYNIAFGFRFMRFFFIFLAAVLGFFGISTGLFVLLCTVVSMKSFGVPFFAPIAPRTGPSYDLIVRHPEWNQELRPDYLQTLDVRRQPNISRKWSRGLSSQNPDNERKKH
jgi:spore germination protein KA